MLKIKNNIDLKELEKFGFGFHSMPQISEYRSFWYIGFPVDNSVVAIYEDNREIDVRNRQVTLDWQPIDTLFDLIKADLVEKVKNE